MASESFQISISPIYPSSGRVRLYETAINVIQEHPLLGDKMITYDGDILYVHNLFLQVGRDFGVIAVVAVVVFVLYCLDLLATRKLSQINKTVIAIIFCVSVVRLMVSSIIWERPEFWALACLTLGHKNVFITE